MQTTPNTAPHTPAGPQTMAEEMTALLNAANTLAEVPLLPIETVLAGQANIYNLVFQKMMMNIFKEKSGFSSLILDNGLRAQKQCQRILLKIKELEESAKKNPPVRTEGN
jgi:hypothetical protein